MTLEAVRNGEEVTVSGKSVMTLPEGQYRLVFEITPHLQEWTDSGWFHLSGFNLYSGRKTDKKQSDGPVLWLWAHVSDTDRR